MERKTISTLYGLLNALKNGHDQYGAALQALDFTINAIQPSDPETAGRLRDIGARMAHPEKDPATGQQDQQKAVAEALTAVQALIPQTEDTGKRKIVFINHQSLGDIAVLTAAVRDLMTQHGDKFIVDAQTNAPGLWDHNPHLTPLDRNDPDVETVEANYPLIQKSNTYPVHFMHSFREHMEGLFGVRIEPGEWAGSIYISPEEMSWYSVVYEALGRDVPYWIIDAGYKRDFTAKQWDFRRYQEIIDSCPDLTFVQIGIGGDQHHIHPQLTGDNLIDLVGKTDDRQLVRLVYNAFGVVTPVSSPMVLAYLIPPHPRFKRNSRACVVLSGGREPNTWQQGPNQQMIHTCGMLPCCDRGGCWKSRVVPLNDGDEKDQSLCQYPVELDNGQIIPKCMDMISAQDVIRLIRQYMDNLEFKYE